MRILRDSGIDVIDWNSRGYVKFRNSGNSDDEYLCYIVRILSREELENFLRETQEEKCKKEIVVLENIVGNVDLELKRHRIEVVRPEEVCAWLGKYVIDRLLRLESEAESVDEDFIRKLLVEDGNVNESEIEKEIEAVMSDFRWMEEVEDGIPIYLDDFIEGNNENKYPIIKPYIMDERSAVHTLEKNLGRKVQETEVYLELVPCYLYKFSAKVFRENDSSYTLSQGFVMVNSLTGEGAVLRNPLLTVDDLPGLNIKIRYLPRVDEKEAYNKALEIVRIEHTREEERKKDLDTVTIFEKVRTYPEEIQLSLDSILYYPIWKIKVRDKEYAIDGLTADVVFSQASKFSFSTASL